MMDFPNPSIPLRLYIDFGGDFGDEDVHEHEVRFHVAGAPESQVVAMVQTDPVLLPCVLRYRRRGELDLPAALLDSLFVICLSRLIENLVLTDGMDTEVVVPDGAEWLQRSLAPSDAALAIVALGKHINAANTVRDFAWLRQPPKNP